MIGEEKGSVAISGRSSHKMTGLLLTSLERYFWNSIDTLKVLAFKNQDG